MQYFCAMDAQVGCYFSHALDLTNRIQNWFSPEKGAKINESGANARLPENDRFVWNTHLLYPALKTCKTYEFVNPIICGFVGQQSVDIEERRFTFGIISRRSRFQGGPRFLRRGVNTEGDVANEVETDQFFFEQNPYISNSFRISSFTMVTHS